MENLKWKSYWGLSNCTPGMICITGTTRNTLTQASKNGCKPYLFPQKKFVSVFYAIHIINTMYRLVNLSRARWDLVQSEARDHIEWRVKGLYLYFYIHMIIFVSLFLMMRKTNNWLGDVFSYHYFSFECLRQTIKDIHTNINQKLIPSRDIIKKLTYKLP